MWSCHAGKVSCLKTPNIVKSGSKNGSDTLAEKSVKLRDVKLGSPKK